MDLEFSRDGTVREVQDTDGNVTEYVDENNLYSVYGDHACPPSDVSRRTSGAVDRKSSFEEKMIDDSSRLSRFTRTFIKAPFTNAKTLRRGQGENN